jgi:hypothetical protein
MKFHCDCGEEAIYPWHCGEHMNFDVENKVLQCEICRATAEVPKHCEKLMKVVVEKS